MNTRGAGVRRWRLMVVPVVLAMLAVGLSGAPAAYASPHRTTPSVRAGAVPAGSFVPLTPTRILDTRTGAAIPARDSTVLTVAGRAGVPTSGVASVAFVMTAVRETAGGYLTMYPDGTNLPTVVSVNFAAGFARSNTVLSQLGAAGAVRIFNGATAPSNVTVDVSGYYTAGSATAGGAFVPITPTRLLDTRDGTEPQAEESRTVAVTGHAGIPAHVAAVIANVGAFASTRSGHVASGSSFSRIVSYFAAGQAVGNLMVIPVTSRDGTILVTNVSAGPAQLYVDAVGYVVSGQPSTAGLFGSTGSSPTALDTRGTGSKYKKTPVPAGQTVSATVVGTGLNVPTGASAVAVQVTVTDDKASGYVTAYPAGSDRPTTAALVFTAGRNMANTVLVPVGTNNEITFYNGTAGPLDVIAQIVGFVGAIAGPYTWTSPLAAFDDPSRTGPGDCASATFCLETDFDGHYAIWDGHQLSAPMDTGLGTGTYPIAVSCPANGVCVLLHEIPGGDLISASATYHDGAWHAGPILPAGPAQAYPNHISCTSASFCAAVGQNFEVPDRAWTFDGSTWTLESIPLNEPAWGVSCGSPTLCLAADGESTAWYDGSTWHATTSAMANPHYPSCVSSTLCVMASLFHTQTFDRSGWGPLISTNSLHSTEQQALSCVSASYCVGIFATNYGAGTALAYYDGSAWSDRSVIGYPGSSNSLSCRTTSFCAITGAFLTVGTR